MHDKMLSKTFMLLSSKARCIYSNLFLLVIYLMFSKSLGFMFSNQDIQVSLKKIKAGMFMQSHDSSKLALNKSIKCHKIEMKSSCLILKLENLGMFSGGIIRIDLDELKHIPKKSEFNFFCWKSFDKGAPKEVTSIARCTLESDKR